MGRSLSSAGGPSLEPVESHLCHILYPALVVEQRDIWCWMCEVEVEAVVTSAT